MNFKTEVKIPTYPLSISHQDGIVSFGSCFSENMGQKLIEKRFDVLVNPFGILFNPISVANAINHCVENKVYQHEDLSCNKEVHFSFGHHSKFSGLDSEKVLTGINSSINEAHIRLKKAKVIILTFGSAWVYRHNETKEIVANCYKLPSSFFTKELLTIDDICLPISQSISRLIQLNPEIKIITTISPVRHWKDGVVESQQSKATLHLALKQINEQTENCVYFPSYEILLDELRDYRFYANDMLHPSDLAIEYIWKKFGEAFFEVETAQLNKRIEQINREKNHKPFNPNSDNFRSFANQLEEKENQLIADFPFLDIKKE